MFRRKNYVALREPITKKGRENPSTLIRGWKNIILGSIRTGIWTLFLQLGVEIEHTVLLYNEFDHRLELRWWFSLQLIFVFENYLNLETLQENWRLMFFMYVLNVYPSVFQIPVTPMHWRVESRLRNGSEIIRKLLLWYS